MYSHIVSQPPRFGRGRRRHRDGLKTCLTRGKPRELGVQVFPEVGVYRLLVEFLKLFELALHLRLSDFYFRLRSGDKAVDDLLILRDRFFEVLVLRDRLRRELVAVVAALTEQQ